MGLQALPIGSSDLDFTVIHNQSLLWRAVALAERFVAGVLLLLCLPVLLLAALVIIFLARRSPLIAHRRVGQGGRAIWVLKLRTMWCGSEAGCYRALFVERLTSQPTLEIKTRMDPRVTSRFAALCRKYSIDECPQLWHVVRGEMALIGPRPLTAHEVTTYYGPNTVSLLTSKPGITGLWQIKGRSRLTYSQRRRLDLFLVRHWSLRLYIKIFIATIPSVLTGKNAW